MIISKYKDNINFVVDKKLAKESKNGKYYLFSFDKDFIVGLDDKKQAKLCELVNMKKLVDNAKK